MTAHDRGPQLVDGPLAAPVGDPLLEVIDLSVAVDLGDRRELAVDRVSFTVAAGEARGLVGESGSGKSLTLRAIMGLLPTNVTVTGGQILFQGRDLLADGGRWQQQIRGTGITMIFQEPAVALNPVLRVGDQVADGLREHRGLSRRAAREQAVRLLELVGVPDPGRRANAYPHELSGGLRQRVMIAAGVSCEPELILCDEPTTALDVTIQDQILRLFAHLRDELGAALLYVTHDLAVVAQLCDTISVLYAGRVMEDGQHLQSVFEHPAHPYTGALLAATPQIDGPVRRLEAIPGAAPALADRPAGCPFHDRCPRATEECRQTDVPVEPIAAGRLVACLHPLLGSEVEVPS
ncbi:ABC transporter ATP-binding protein [Microlunatus soli]|uniref:Peptide/nickel transport system ATP-binding protein n=1 Tax=Microlunatus soli TaxID=630515 RepID=A0A1H1UFX9_9ACTN|nr:ABC transporter ATP-binding protein [Microlunatus soli]SDS71191.1 peptide/nickel transport system ATP-binding protein [Microlunatus soli]